MSGEQVAAAVYYAGAATVENVQVLSGSVNATSYAAGIIMEGSGTTIKNCVNYANINADVWGAAGIGAWIVDNAAIDGCTNNGTVTGGNRAGGICGNFAGTMTNCVNNGAVASTGKGAAGGMIGIMSAASTIENCTNNGAVTTTADNVNASAAGILGQNPGSKQATIKSCVNTGAITAENSHAAGVAVSLYGKTTVSGSSNTGTITGAKSANEIIAPKGVFGGNNTVS